MLYEKGEKIMADFLKFFLPLVGAVVAWLANEWQKSKREEYQRKEEKYQVLLNSLKGFYITTPSSEAKKMKEVFLDQLALCWLYCPDEVIKKAYAFLVTVQTDIKCTDVQKEKALGEFVLAIRQDLLLQTIVRTTNLKPEDFKILKAT
ncbi:MAG: hypothetical protein RAP41_07720 [Candidatus Orphnella occulta]|nr:hypothetical protein [Candidatus Orphnella occulta]